MGGRSISLRTCRERREQELDTAGSVQQPQGEQTELSWSQGKRGREREGGEERGGGEGGGGQEGERESHGERDPGGIRLSASWGRAMLGLCPEVGRAWLREVTQWERADCLADT